jgi:hypothetical protein
MVPALWDERARILGPLEALAGGAHVLLALAGGVVEAASVDYAHVGDAGVLEGAA